MTDYADIESEVMQGGKVAVARLLQEYVSPHTVLEGKKIENKDVANG